MDKDFVYSKIGMALVSKSKSWVYLKPTCGTYVNSIKIYTVLQEQSF